jgi:hypothetical protein|tara:strand:+ start:253 stop:456 length:204 start_codon:yes stop_codon:yes gene_type:complete
MKTIINLLAATFVMLGLAMMAGSAGDCDGACMAQANTMTEMLTLAGIGLSFFLVGGALLVSNHREVA